MTPERGIGIVGAADGRGVGGPCVVRAAIALLTILLMVADPIAANEILHQWYVGGSVAFHTTQDTVRSNADEPGDPRPDDFVSREIGIQDTASYGLAAGFGMTRWLSLQLDTGYFRSTITPIEAYLSDAFPVSVDPFRPEVLNAIKHREAIVPVNAGVITEIPVSLSGVIRFRTDRPVNPFVGAGLGILFNGLQTDPDIADFNERLGKLRIWNEKSESGRSLVPFQFLPFVAPGRIPFTYPITLAVKNGFEWHLTAGMEYFISRRVSLLADLRYTFATPGLTIDLEGQDQVDISIYSEKLFRKKDGSLRVFNNQGVQPNPLVDPNDPSRGLVTCKANTVGDFDHDGHADDHCYANDTANLADQPVGVLLVQGGRIGLSGYAVQFGMRCYF